MRAFMLPLFITGALVTSMSFAQKNADAVLEKSTKTIEELFKGPMLDYNKHQNNEQLVNDIERYGKWLDSELRLYLSAFPPSRVPQLIREGKELRLMSAHSDYRINFDKIAQSEVYIDGKLLKLDENANLEAMLLKINSIYGELHKAQESKFSQLWEMLFPSAHAFEFFNTPEMQSGLSWAMIGGVVGLAAAAFGNGNMSAATLGIGSAVLAGIAGFSNKKLQIEEDGAKDPNSTEKHKAAQ